MKFKAMGMSKILRVSGIFLILGLAIETVSLLFNHPLSFMGFIIVGGTFLGVGVLLFLFSLVSIAQANPSSPQK
jgi:hypothetical protein